MSDLRCPVAVSFPPPVRPRRYCYPDEPTSASGYLAEHRAYLRQLEAHERQQQQATITLTPPSPSRVEAARCTLRSRVEWYAITWIDTELVGGFVTARARRRHELEQQCDRARRDLERADLEAIAALPDDDLAWLLSMGWQPDAYPWGVS